MKQVRVLVFLSVLCILSCTMWGTAPAVAQSGGNYDLSWNTIDGGGGTSSGGSYILSGTLGQPDANLLSGGDYTLGSGFWGGGALAGWYKVYLPLVMRR
jgi:hypothetical protein